MLQPLPPLNEDKINALLAQITEIGNSANLTPREAVVAASKFLCSCIASVIDSEKDAHDVLNDTVESGHIYLNSIWPEVMRQKRLDAGR